MEETPTINPNIEISDASTHAPSQHQQQAGSGSDLDNLPAAVPRDQQAPPRSTSGEQDSLRSSVYESSPVGRTGGNLFFQMGNQGGGDDDEEQRLELERGREFEATYIVSESAGKFREVVMNINLNGITVTEPKNKKRKREFDIEHILQYSYNRAQSRFTYAYLEADGVLTNYRFISPDFFDIHQTLGSAIAMMVKMKTADIGSTPRDESAIGASIGNSSEALSTGAPKTSTDNSHLQVSNGESPAQVKRLGINDDVSKSGSNLFQTGSPLPEPRKVISSETTASEAPSDISSAAAAAEKMSKSQESLAFEPVFSANVNVVVHAGDDDTASIMTTDVANENGDDDTASQVDTFEAGDSDKYRGKISKKDQKSFSKTMRGWSLFGPNKAASLGVGAATGSKSKKGPNELKIIQEADVSGSFMNMDAGGSFAGLNTIRSKSSSNNSERRRSAMDLYENGDATQSKSSLSTTGTMVEGATSAASIDTVNIREKTLPAVDIQHDEWGRETLIKNLNNGKYDITAGTIDCLVASLAEEAPPDTIYIEVFLLTYRHFMKPLQLIQLLKKRFTDTLTAADAKKGTIVRLRVVSVLKKWAERHYYDFRFPEMQECLAEFMTVINNSECGKYGAQITGILTEENERAKTFKEVIKEAPPPDVQKILDRVDPISQWSPKKMAQELTLSDLRLFRLIKPDEFCLFLWGEKNDPRIANFNAYIDRFNRIGFWVSTVIVKEKDIKRRVEAIEKFIQVGKYCQKYQNYSSLMAILSGLNTTAVSRLKKTWELVNKSRYIGAYHELEDKMSYRSNFKAYREIEGHAKQPFIPFFGIYVKDLTFMNDGNQKHLVLPDSESGTKSSMLKEGNDAADAPPRAPMINFEKCRSITDKIHAIRVYQQSTYKFEDESAKDEPGFFSAFAGGAATVTDADMVTYFSHPHGPPCVDDEKTLANMSRECEASGRSGAPSPAPAATSNYTAVSAGPTSNVASTKPRSAVDAADNSPTPSATASESIITAVSPL
eukprot:Partr_v1_DN28145_c0_g1_i4_m56149 putative Son of sevenless homolog